MKKKITAVALAVCILVVGIVGATMSYFTDTEKATNTFTFGKGVEIKLTEDGTATTGTDGTTEITLIPAKETSENGGLVYDKVVPGVYYAKKPTVELLNGGRSAPAYIVVTATFTDATRPFNPGGKAYVGDTETPITSEKIGNTYFYYFPDVIKPGTTVSPFEWIQLDPSVNNADTNENSGTLNVEVRAYAILAAGFDNCKAAFKAAFGSIAGDASETKEDAKTPTTDAPTVFTLPVVPTTAGSTEVNTTVSFTANALTAGEEYKVSATTYGVESAAANFSIKSNDDVIAAITVDLSKGNAAADFNGTATITTYIAKGLTNPKVIYNGTGDQPTVVSYNSENGELVFTTTHFSTYIVTVARADAFNQTTGKVYATLADAIAASAKGDVIIMLKDVDNATGITVDSGKEFTVDFNGHTYTLNKPGAGSTGTKTNGFQLLEGSKITFQNGTIKCAAENKEATWVKESTVKGIAMMIQNYADLTLKKMTVDGTNIAHNGAATRYVLSNNCGNVLYDGCTIIAAEGDFAFDTCKYGNYAAPTVTVKNTKVTGKVDISGGNFVDAGNNTFSDDSGWYVDGAEEFTLYTAAQLKDFAAKVNAGNTFNGKTVKLGADIDLKGIAWTPIGGVSAYPSITFHGIFDGQNHTISNMNASDTLQNHASAGLFGSLIGTIKNVNMKNVTVTSTHYAGAICGFSSCNGCTIENCHVDGGTIISTPEKIGESYDNGDKVGGIIGYIVSGDKVTGCSVKNVTVKAYRDVGGVVGCAINGTSYEDVKNCSIENVKVVAGIGENYNKYTSDTQFNAGSIVGRAGGELDSSNTGTATISYEYSK